MGVVLLTWLWTNTHYVAHGAADTSTTAQWARLRTKSDINFSERAKMRMLILWHWAWTKSTVKLGVAVIVSVWRWIWVRVLCLHCVHIGAHALTVTNDPAHIQHLGHGRRNTRRRTTVGTSKFCSCHVSITLSLWSIESVRGYKHGSCERQRRSVVKIYKYARSFRRVQSRWRKN